MMRIVMLVLGALAAADAVWAQSVSVSTVSGQVVEQASGRGLADAQIELLPTNRTTAADRDGRWRFDRVEAGAYHVRVTLAGFAVETIAIVVADGGVPNLEVVLTPRAQRLHESVTVTALRQPAPSYDVPRSITVIDRRELDERLPRSTPEALWDAAGVFVQKTNHGGGSPYLRGLIGNQVLVLVDGIRLNNATFRYGPNQYLATIDPASIERIEVVRGAGSVLYGSDAMGGVINIVTKTAPGVGQPFAVHSQAATKFATSAMEQTGRFEASASGPRGGWRGGLSVRNFGDLRAGRGLGVESPSGYTELAVDTRADLLLSRSGRLTLAYQHDHQGDVPRWDQVTQRGFARYAFDPQVRRLGYARYEQTFASAWLRQFKATASVQRNSEQREYQRRDADILTVERDDVLVSGVSLEVQSRPVGSLAIVSGLDYYADRVQSAREDRTGGVGPGLSKRGLYPSGAAADAVALFSHATITHARWIIDGGVRVGRSEVSAPDPLFGSAHIRPAMVTASGGAMFAIAPWLRGYGTVSQAFRAPNIDDLSSLGQFDFGVEVPSPQLDPETSVTVEGGVKMRTTRAAASLAVYRSGLDRLIERVPGLFEGSPLRDGQAVYRKTNVGSALVRGVELDADVAVAAPVTLRGSLTYTHGQVTTIDEPMRRIPPLNGLVALRLTPAPRWWAEAAVRFAAKQDRLASGDIADYRIPAGGTPGWTVLNVNAGVRVRPGLELVGALQNLSDEPYRTHGSGIDGVGRSAWVGLTATLR